MPPEVRARIIGPMADAFASTFWWASVLVAIALVVSTALLPKEKPSRSTTLTTPAAEAAPAVLVG